VKLVTGAGRGYRCNATVETEGFHGLQLLDVVLLLGSLKTHGEIVIAAQSGSALYLVRECGSEYWRWEASLDGDELLFLCACRACVVACGVWECRLQAGEMARLLLYCHLNRERYCTAAISLQIRGVRPITFE
jgi:hypothetical protein